MKSIKELSQLISVIRDPRFISEARDAQEAIDAAERLQVEFLSVANVAEARIYALFFEATERIISDALTVLMTLSIDAFYDATVMVQRRKLDQANELLGKDPAAAYEMAVKVLEKAQNAPNTSRAIKHREKQERLRREAEQQAQLHLQEEARYNVRVQETQASVTAAQARLVLIKAKLTNADVAEKAEKLVATACQMLSAGNPEGAKEMAEQAKALCIEAAKPKLECATPRNKRQTNAAIARGLAQSHQMYAGSAG